MKSKYGIILLLLVIGAFLVTACSSSEPEVTTQRPTESTTGSETVAQDEQTGSEMTTAEDSSGDEKPQEEPDETEPEAEYNGIPELVWSVKHEEKLESVAASPDGQTLAVGEYLTAYIHRVADGELVDVFIYDHSAEDVDYSPDGTQLAAGLSVYGVSLTDVSLGRDIHKLHGGYNNRVAFSPDGKSVATGNREGTIWIWNADDGQQVAALDAPETKWVTSIDYHPSGELLAATQWTDEGVAHVWDLKEEQVVHTFTLDVSLGNTKKSFLFSPDGEIMTGLIKEDREYYIRFWTVEEAEEIWSYETHRNFKDMAFSPDGKLLAVASQQGTNILDVEEQKLLYTLEHEFDQEVSDWLIALAFTPDGGHVAVARWDGTVEMWRLPGAEPIVAPPIDMRTPPPLPSDVLFDTGSAVLKEEANPELGKFAEELYDNFKKATITIIGHTDSRGAEEDNMQLSLERANAIMVWFRNWANENDAKGWDFKTEGRGESELKVSDVDVEGNFLEEAGALNRRVEIELDTAD